MEITSHIVSAHMISFLFLTKVTLTVRYKQDGMWRKGKSKEQKGSYFTSPQKRPCRGEVDELDYIFWVNWIKLTDGDFFNEVKTNSHGSSIRTAWVNGIIY